MSDNVNSPAHYTQEGRKECIEEMLEKFGAEAVMDFCKLNAYKYEYRADFKNGDEDRYKAAWYRGFLKALEIFEFQKWTSVWDSSPVKGQMVLIQSKVGNHQLTVAVWNGEEYECLSDKWVLEACTDECVEPIYLRECFVEAVLPLPVPPLEILEEHNDSD